jgi:hypothetical protein
LVAHRKYPVIAVGAKYGFLSAVSFSWKNSSGLPYWKFRCNCGTEKDIRVSHVQSGAVVSCGCHKAAQARTHGLSGLPEYKVWAAMIARCKNPTNPNYANYGARGIKVCSRWSKFKNFISDMGQRPFPEASLERIENNKGYCPSNCEWVTRAVQAKNTRRSRLIDYRGQMINLTEAAKLAGVDPSTMWHRINNGWDVIRAVETPPLSP